MALPGRVKSYQMDDCPQLEAFRGKLCLFKTGIQTRDRFEAQA